MSKDDEMIVREENFPSDVEFDDDEGDSDSSTDVDAKLAEDDVFDIAFFKCYSALKKRDEKVYDKKIRFFDEDEDDKTSDEDEAEESAKNIDQETTKTLKTSKAPRMTLLDHQLNMMEEEEQLEKPKVNLNEEVSKSYYEKELEEIKKSIQEAGQSDDDDDGHDLLVVKGSNDRPGQSKSKKKIQYMLDKFEDAEDEDLNHLKEIWADSSKLNEDDKFLRDYIVNKLYLPQNIEDDSERGYFSKNLDDLSDAEDEDNDKKESKKKKQNIINHSDEKNFDQIKRIPRNSTKTIRDLVEKKEKKEKRLKASEKQKKKKQALKNADFEDIVGDITTKFHYRETEPNDYGLTPEELLMATDEELEKWCKLKDAIAYKSVEDELREKRKYDERRNDIEMKKKIFKSIYGTPESATAIRQEDEAEVSKNRNRKRKRKYSDEFDETANEPTPDEQPPVDSRQDPEDSNSKKKKKRKRGVNHKKFAKSGVAPDRLLAYGLSKNKLKKSKLL